MHSITKSYQLHFLIIPQIFTILHVYYQELGLGHYYSLSGWPHEPPHFSSCTPCSSLWSVPHFAIQWCFLKTTVIILTFCLKQYHAFLVVLKERRKSLTHLIKPVVGCSYTAFHLQLYFVWLSPFFLLFECFTLPKPINQAILSIYITHLHSPNLPSLYPSLQNQANHHFWLLGGVSKFETSEKFLLLSPNTLDITQLFFMKFSLEHLSWI